MSDIDLQKQDLGKLVRARTDYGGFYKLVRYREDHWGATGVFNKEGVEVRGETPEKAVANLMNELKERGKKIEEAG